MITHNDIAKATSNICDLLRIHDVSKREVQRSWINKTTANEEQNSLFEVANLSRGKRSLLCYAFVYVCVSLRGFKPWSGSGQTKQNSYLKPKHTRGDMKVRMCVFGLNVYISACSCSWSQQTGWGSQCIDYMQSPWLHTHTHTHTRLLSFWNEDILLESTVIIYS